MQGKARNRKRKKGGGGTTALQGSHQTKKGKNRRRERERRAVEQPPHCREVIRTRKHSEQNERLWKKPLAAFRLSLQTTLLTP
jgi:hypothetical protein